MANPVDKMTEDLIDTENYAEANDGLSSCLDSVPESDSSVKSRNPKRKAETSLAIIPQNEKQPRLGGRLPGERFFLRRVTKKEPNDGFNEVELTDKLSCDIGRMKSCQVVLEDLRISRKHAQIRRDFHGRWTIIAFSQNGILVNKTAVAPTCESLLEPGDKIIFAIHPHFTYEFIREVDDIDSSEEIKPRVPERLQQDPFDFGLAAADVKRQQRKEVEMIQMTQKNDNDAMVAELEANRLERMELEEHMEKLGSELESKTETLEKKQKAEEALREKIEELAEREAILKTLLEQREEKYGEELQRVKQNSEAKLRQIADEYRSLIESREAELAQQKEEARIAADEAKTAEQLEEKKRLEQFEHQLTEMKAKAEEEIASAKQQLLADVGRTINAELECPICQEIFVKAVTLNCTHSFCMECLQKWSQVSGVTRADKGVCPTCRTKIVSSNPSRAIDSLVEVLIKSMSPEKQTARKAMEALHEAWRKERERPVIRSRGRPKSRDSTTMPNIAVGRRGNEHLTDLLARLTNDRGRSASSRVVDDSEETSATSRVDVVLRDILIPFAANMHTRASRFDDERVGQSSTRTGGSWPLPTGQPRFSRF